MTVSRARKMATRPPGHSQPEASPPATPAIAASGWPGQADLKRQLWWQMGVAALLILAALAALLLLDYLNMADEEMPAAPRFTQPVPVRKPPPPEKAAAPPAETPPLVPLVAEPQASGAALEKGLPSVELSSSPSGQANLAAAAGEESAPAVEPLAVPAARLLSGYVVQSGVLPDVRQAEALQARFVAEGIPASMELRLQLGPFRTRAEAEAARRKIKGLGIDGLITVGKVSRP
ncbi:SPOR domain-containing protein [Accumulibacter sp.]|nr:SPOR domain-containing protein [Accumulibacter sp.]